MKLIRIIPLFLLISCAGSSKYEIKGTLPDPKFNSEWVFLAPLTGGTAQTVDSVRVKKQSFSFRGRTEQPGVKVIRMRPIMRLEIQELLVVVEPGKIRVTLDSLSSVTGTPQNDALQSWKEFKAQTDQTLLMLQQMIDAATDDTVKAKLTSRRDQIVTDFNEYNRLFAKSNEGTALGDFVSKLTGQ
jgi:hypothetical protein